MTGNDEDIVYEDVEDIEGEEGHWVAVRNGKTVMTSSDPAEVYRFAGKYPPGQISVTKVLYAGACFY